MGVKITVAGNATLDVFVDSVPRITSSKVEFTDALGHTVEFMLQDPPKNLQGKKVRVNQNLASEVRTLTHHYESGGGGYNSVMAIRNLEIIGKLFTLQYFDVSNPDRTVAMPLREAGILYRFFYDRDLPVNIIVGHREDKLILKGPTMGRVSPRAETVRDIGDLLHGSDSMLINSLKDPNYFEEYLRVCGNKIPVYSTVTGSFDKDFTYGVVLPGTRPILNYDELPSLGGIGTEYTGTERVEMAIEELRHIRVDRINPEMPLFATLSRHGMLGATKSKIYQVKLNEDLGEKVHEAAKRNTQGIRGAGDVAAGALVAYDTVSEQRQSIPKLLVLANTAAIRHIGYAGPLPESAFEVIEHNLKPASVPVISSQSGN
jgi:hypothetical protein